MNPKPAPGEAASGDRFRGGIPLAAGTKLGEYEITGVIGEGGFGIVYLAHDLALDRRIAIKEYMPGSLADREEDGRVVVRTQLHEPTFRAGMRSFINEAKMLAAFDHPALVRVWSFWEQNGTAYMAMPLYEGRTLKALLRDTPKPAEAFLRRLLGPLLDALDLLHRSECYHRDVSPDNIMILPDGSPVLLDFGAARHIIGNMTQDVTVILKPGFAPIEQYADDPSMRQGPWTDIYAVAAVLRLAITGKPPPTPITRIVSDTMKPLRGSDLPYSAHFLDGIDRGLAVRPEQRPQSITQFREALGIAAPRPASTLASEIAAASPPPVAAAPPPLRPAPAAVSTPAPSVADPPASRPLPAIDAEARPAAVPPAQAGEEDVTRLLPGSRRPIPRPAEIPATEILPTEIPRAESTAVKRRSPATPEPVSAPPSPAPRPGARKALLGALLAAAAVVAATTYWVLRPSSPEPRSRDTIAAAKRTAAAPTAAAAPDPARAATPATTPPATPAAPATITGPAATASAPASATTAPVPAPIAETPARADSALPPAQVSPAARPTPRDETPAAPTAVPTAAPAPAASAGTATPGAAARVAPPPKAEPAAPAAPPPAPTPKPGRLQLAIRPWGQVVVDGKPRGVSPPLKELALPEGRHRIELRNPGFPGYVGEVDVKAGGSVVVQYTFRAR